MGVSLPALTCHGLHYLHFFLIVPDACLSVKTPLLMCEVYFAGIVDRRRYMGVFTLFTVFTLFFDSAGWLFECKNSFVKVRGLLCGYSRRQEIHGGFSTISAISAVF